MNGRVNGIGFRFKWEARIGWGRQVIVVTSADNVRALGLLNAERPTHDLT